MPSFSSVNRKGAGMPPRRAALSGRRFAGFSPSGAWLAAHAAQGGWSAFSPSQPWSFLAGGRSPSPRSALPVERPQAKLRVGQADDVFEREADRVADQVVKTSEAAGGAATEPGPPPAGPPPAIQRMSEGPATSAAGGAPSPRAEAVTRVLDRPGHPLPDPVRRSFEPLFSADFGGVQIHADSEAARSAAALGARAYTSGRHIVFASREYLPDTSDGKRLLAHELTHVVQQGNRAASRPQSGAAVQRKCEACSKDEEEHDETAAGPAVMVQRQPAATPASANAKSKGHAAIVEDSKPVGPGQTHRSEFLAALRDSVVDACEAELNPVGRSAKNCPAIFKSIDYYESHPLSTLVRFVHRFGHAPVGTSAQGLIAAVTARARRAARKLAASGGTQLQAMSEQGDGLLAPHDPSMMRARLGGGRSFEGPVREEMEARFDASFEGVHLHTDAQAAHLNSELRARAFTVGKEIAFGAGQYRPGTPPGDTLLAHELAHTLQQTGGAGEGSGAAPPAAERPRVLEQQADHAAATALAGRTGAASVVAGVAPGLRVQRDGVGEALIVAALIFGEGATDVAIVDGVVVTAAAETTTVVATEAAAPALVEAVPAVVGDVAAPAVADVATTGAVSSTAATTTTAVSSTASTTASTVAVASTAAAASTTLSSDSATSDSTQDKDKDKADCSISFVPHLGSGGKYGPLHSKCADVGPPNVMPGFDAFLRSPKGNKNFDALDPAENLWEVKTGDPSTYPPFLQGPQATGVTEGLDEIELENEIALSCGRHFILGVRTDTARAWYRDQLPDIDIRVISC